MTAPLGQPPVLSTPDTHIFNDTAVKPPSRSRKGISDEQLEITYEIARTVAEIKKHQWRRIALQFPDQMLPDSARVYQLLARGLKQQSREPTQEKLTILADTSYGSCCVDEIAAEHVDADAVVHYGRACLSPTARLPVLHIFTLQPLDHDAVVRAFTKAFPDLSSKIILMADVTFASHVQRVYELLTEIGYEEVFAAAIIHDPSSPIPNRVVPDTVKSEANLLRDYQMFYISEPPTSLLLTLSSRVGNIHIYPTTPRDVTGPNEPLLASSSLILRRRYALITSLTTVSIWGILINTLSVKNYLHIVDHVKSQIATAGKKSYLFVVGKLNAAKVANFAEIGGWVVIGCWESSLVDSKDFYRPVITPFELDLALKGDNERLWTGQWSANFQQLLDDASSRTNGESSEQGRHVEEETAPGNYDSEEESAPPEFDLRTGRYVSQSRPMRASRPSASRLHSGEGSMALTRRPKGDMVAGNGMVSPAATYLRSQRTWQGLGSEITVQYEEQPEGVPVEEGRSGIARGYSVGTSERA